MDEDRPEALANPASQQSLWPVESELSSTVRDFIERNIVSVEELEVLLLLHESSGRNWSPPEINARLRSQEFSIGKWLEALVSLGLAARSEEGFHFAPATEELKTGTVAVAEAYRERRIKVIEQIFSKPDETLLNFIRAFKLRNRP